ncbi:MAG: L-aspartate oxidase [Pseudomonadota bacterium]
MAQHLSYDVLIIGAGAAGLSLALRLAEHANIAVLCKASHSHSSTYWAQGGIAAVLDDEDSVEAHVKDTLIAGSGLCDEAATTHIIEHSSSMIQWLIDLGTPFTKQDDPNDNNEYHLTKEGGHGHRRIIHADDATGKAVATTLLQHAIKHPNIHLIEEQMVIDLIIQDGRCSGAYVLNNHNQSVDVYQAKCVALATGGASKTYLYTTNPHGSSGDGIAMAWRAGCRVANMEFNQFHPTCLHHPNTSQPFLITEALRGEGALLKLPINGERFMSLHDERLELAPRDIVARAIDHEMKRHGLDFVHLDISHKPKDFIIHHFPTIYEHCLNIGIDITKGPIPVVPAAHYTCGGIVIDRDGQTEINGLYALGECTFTGLHGANRLASNSILECLVHGYTAAESIASQLSQLDAPAPSPAWDESQVTNPDEKVILSHNWDELRRFMWDYVGIVRTTKRLERALRRIELLKQEVHDYYAHFKVDGDLIELRNLLLVAELIVLSSMERKESIGLHFTLDFPDATDTPRNTVLVPDNAPTP